ncbi:hypothetical protein BDN71DRAFT_1242 [Pleurotus eryngii]|uniref:Uncharacterized protein n=1 Tax=Pleurotus eryngii TaxID=5323 RepID=A0A9P6DEK8_PLEER|nr:hypothetical protein BDN71DRAFT_1242 [Pleurotus eryngii]
MPPGPVFNAVCVASALSNVLSNALRIRANQLASQTASRATTTPRKHKRDVSEAVPEDAIQRHGHLPGDMLKVVQMAVEDAMSSVPPRTSNVVQEVENNHSSLNQTGTTLLVRR